MTGMEVAERKSVMRFLRTISLSALPGSRREEETAESWLLKSGDSCLVCNKTMREPREAGGEEDRRGEAPMS